MSCPYEENAESQSPLAENRGGMPEAQGNAALPFVPQGKKSRRYIQTFCALRG